VSIYSLPTLLFFYLIPILTAPLSLSLSLSHTQHSTKKRIDNATQRFTLPDTSHIHTNSAHVPPIFVIQVRTATHAVLVISYGTLITITTVYDSLSRYKLKSSVFLNFLPSLCSTLHLTGSTSSSPQSSCATLLHHISLVLLDTGPSSPFSHLLLPFSPPRFRSLPTLLPLSSRVLRTGLGGRSSCTIGSRR
jgi:hypothetical protein